MVRLTVNPSEISTAATHAAIFDAVPSTGIRPELYAAVSARATYARACSDVFHPGVIVFATVTVAGGVPPPVAVSVVEVVGDGDGAAGVAIRRSYARRPAYV